MMPEYLDGEQGAADRPDNGMDGVPGGIHPRNFVRKKFQEIENAGDRNDPRMPENFERLVIGRERDPMEMNGEARNENGEVKIDTREAGEPERDAQEVESVHGRNIRPALRLSSAFAVAAPLGRRERIRRHAATERRGYSAFCFDGVAKICGIE